jgi:KaiC/GvpD/RAD55 family RecA-like ATPase
MEGGLPKGRSTLLRGEAGSGKTLLAVEEITGNCQMLPDADL